MKLPHEDNQALKEKQKEEANQKPLTREEKRFIERANQEAKEAFDAFANKFFEFFVTHENPESEAVLEKMKSMDAQWRIFCRRRNLKDVAFPLFRNYCQELIKEYQQNKSEAIS